MNYISSNSFILGVVYSICILSISLCYYLLCKFFKIKILEFSIFKSYVHQDEIRGISYKLGWFPFDSSIKPLGKKKDDKCIIEENELKFAYYTKPKYVDIIFTLMPSIVYLVFILVTYQFFLNDDFDSQNSMNHIIDLLTSFFSSSYDKLNFIKNIEELLYNKNIMSFEILILLFILLLLSVLTKIANWSLNFENKSTLSKIFSLILIPIIFYFVYWKIPKFLLSFFSITENLIFIINFLFGAFIFGAILYFTVIIFLKSRQETNLEIKITSKRIYNKNEIFEQLNIFSSNELLNSSATELLLETYEYLKSDTKNSDTKFSLNEFKFNKKINYFLSNKNIGIKKYLPFLITNSENINTNLLNEISILFAKKNNKIKSFYEKDILIVEEFLAYSKQKIKSREVFFYEPEHKDSLWTSKEFPENMFNYLAYQIKSNPTILTNNYIEDMKGYFSFIGLSMEDEEKTRKANHYFSKTKDPFNFNIPQIYDNVKSEIQMSVVVISRNEELLGQIAEDVIKKYGD
ncbi:hypothetical protein LNI98_11705 [Tenacibaculum dicentrarchi]|nr:hypothetical protein [Tenacibaculum dicentrarchi]